MDIVLSFATKGVDVLPPRTLPPKALVLALTPLLDPRSAAALLDLRARGYDLVVIEVSPVPFVEPGKGELAQLSYRLWRLSRESLRARYEQAGVPVVEWRRRRPAQRAAGGGGGIQAIRKARARVALALVVGARLRGRARVRRGPGAVVRRARGRVGVFGALLLAFVLVRRMDDLLPWALGMLGVAYTVSLFVHGSAVDEARTARRRRPAALRRAGRVVARRAARDRRGARRRAAARARASARSCWPASAPPPLVIAFAAVVRRRRPRLDGARRRRRRARRRHGGAARPPDGLRRRRATLPRCSRRIRLVA